jgi:hypothetical protein
LFAEGKYLMKHDSPISDIFEKHADKEDGFLYILYQVEKVYGGEQGSLE